MKKCILACLFMVAVAVVHAQNPLEGAWKSQQDGVSEVLVFQDGYFTATRYTSDRFLETWGGPYTRNDQQVAIQVEFNNTNREMVGKTRTVPIAWKDQQLEFAENTHTRVDDSKAPLAGVWKITHRMQEGNLAPIHTTGPRKTLKILTGTRFQWAAINTETGEFSGTGGGSYTFADGIYVENIEFFSRDQSRVGARLPFNGKVENGSWHHTGLSSKGDQIYEVWGKAF